MSQASYSQVAADTTNILRYTGYKDVGCPSAVHNCGKRDYVAGQWRQMTVVRFDIGM
jgi:hypothetical protein